MLVEVLGDLCEVRKRKMAAPKKESNNSSLHTSATLGRRTWIDLGLMSVMHHCTIKSHQPHKAVFKSHLTSPCSKLHGT